MRGRGFTLIEVLVALAIVAITLGAGLRASSALVSGTERQQDLLLAQLCVENILVRYRLQQVAPEPGRFEETCAQGQRSYLGQVDIQPTPNPNFRRIEVRALREGQVVLQISSIVGGV